MCDENDGLVFSLYWRVAANNNKHSTAKQQQQKYKLYDIHLRREKEEVEEKGKRSLNNIYLF